MSTRWALVISISVTACASGSSSSTAEIASDVPAATDAAAAFPAHSAPSARSAGEPASVAPPSSAPASPLVTVAPVAPASPTDIFAAKIALLDKVDDAIMRGKPAEVAVLAAPEASLELCAETTRAQAQPTIEISKDCSVLSGAPATRAAINVGSRTEVLDEVCRLAKLETSELFYRSSGHSLKVTVQTVAVGKEVHLQRIHCHRSERPTKEPGATNCTGKWPFVTQTREFPQCPWSKP